ncbi:MAG: hypothetical protein ACI9BD_000938 [Candidatus Marinamargulisbacteria bacterium]|jgi:hypothetical protein
MKNELVSRDTQCPYCWETFEVLIDCSVSPQTYIEDCEVCCRPITFNVTIYSNGDIDLATTNEDE